MIDEEIEKEINVQINEELYSAYIYLSMAADFRDKTLSGFASWMEAQAEEEVGHALRLYRYLDERGGRIKLDSIDKPQMEWDSPLDAFEAAYEHEQHITGRINEIYELAEEKGDKATMNMLDWFVEEQVEEEDSADEIVQKLKRVGDNERALLMLDQELGQRAFVDETAEEE